MEYFDPHFNIKVHQLGKMVLVRKNICYKNVILFVLRVQNLVIFKSAIMVKVNMAILLYGFILKQYTIDLNNFDYNILNINLRIKSLINTLLQCFKIPTSITLSFFTNKTYFFEDAQCH